MRSLSEIHFGGGDELTVTPHHEKPQEAPVRNGNGSIKLPKWITSFVWPFCVLTAAIVTRYMDVSVAQTKTDDAIQAIQKELSEIHEEQKTNTLYRQHMQDFEAQYKIDMASILDGQRSIMATIKEHEQQAALRAHRLENSKDPK